MTFTRVWTLIRNLQRHLVCLVVDSQGFPCKLRIMKYATSKATFVGDKALFMKSDNAIGKK